MPECFKVVCIPCKALYKCSAFYLLPCHSPVPVPVVCLSTSDAVSCDHHVGPVQVHRHHPPLFYCVSEETSVVNSVCCVTVTLSLSVLSWNWLQCQWFHECRLTSCRDVADETWTWLMKAGLEYLGSPACYNQLFNDDKALKPQPYYKTRLPFNLRHNHLQTRVFS